MPAQREFYYDQQIRRYLVQFMAIFADMQVRVGWNEDKEPRLVPIPIVNASKDRVVAAIKGENTQNLPIRVPTFSVTVTGLSMAPDRRKGVATSRRSSHMPTGGLFPDDIRVVEQRMPVPYDMEVELALWASNQDQHYQMIEQIAMIFDPDLQIQANDELFDWTRLSRVELEDIRFEENVPAGADRRLIQTTMNFTMPIWISVPSEVHQKYVKDIFIRIGAVTADLTNSYDIIADLDDQGIEYTQTFGLDDVDLDQQT
jgi:hypothetical protein